MRGQPPSFLDQYLLVVPCVLLCCQHFLSYCKQAAVERQALSSEFVLHVWGSPALVGSPRELLTAPLKLRPAFLFERADDGLVEDQFGRRSCYPDDQGSDLCRG